MPKQNLVNLARHSNNIVPVGRPVGIYAKSSAPDGTYTKYPDTAHPATNFLSTAYAAWASTAYWLFNVNNLYLGGVLNEDIIVRITNHETSAKNVTFTSWVPSIGTKTLTLSTVIDGSTVIVGSTTYTFKTTLTTSPSTVANEVLIGGSDNNAAGNLVKAVNDSGTEGTHYGTGTVANADFTATASSPPAVVFTYRHSAPAIYADLIKKASSLAISSSVGTVTPTVTSATNYYLLNTALAWTAVNLGTVTLPPSMPLDIYLPAYHDLYNSSGGSMSISMLIME